MNRRRATASAIGLALVLIVGLGLGLPFGQRSPRVIAPRHRLIYWGAEIGSQLTGVAVPWSMRGLSVFDRLVGRAPSLVAFNIPFTVCAAATCTPFAFPARQMQAIRDHGAIPVLNWSSQYSPLAVSQPRYRLAAVADGHFDRYLRAFARAARAWGHPFFLRFDWEMNGFWFPWAEMANGNHAGDFVRAWRHVHDIFREARATQVSWVWCPVVDNSGSLRDITGLYPGDAYVNWTCLDGYNFGSPLHHPWTTFAQLFTKDYRLITQRIAPTKPMLLGEVGSGAYGGSKPAWLGGMFSSLLAGFPKLFGLVWFDAVDTRPRYRSDGVPLEQTATGLAAFASGIADPRFLGNGFRGLDRLPPVYQDGIGRLRPRPAAERTAP